MQMCAHLPIHHKDLMEFGWLLTVFEVTVIAVNVSMNPPLDRGQLKLQLGHMTENRGNETPHDRDLFRI